MNGSAIAAEIIADMKREEYFKKKYKTKKSCTYDKDKKCNICKYKENCEDM